VLESRQLKIYIHKKRKTSAKYIALSASLPSGLNNQMKIMAEVVHLGPCLFLNQDPPRTERCATVVRQDLTSWAAPPEGVEGGNVPLTFAACTPQGVQQNSKSTLNSDRLFCSLDVMREYCKLMAN